MDLILWRHAHALDALAGADDHLRRLTPRGEKQAARMAAWLDRQLPEETKIYSSPAIRSMETAQALARKYKVRTELLPGAMITDLIKLAQWPHSTAPVMFIGHQPDLGNLAAQLLGYQIENCLIRKGAVWWLRCHRGADSMETTLVCVQSPDYL